MNAAEGRHMQSVLSPQPLSAVQARSASSADDLVKGRCRPNSTSGGSPNLAKP